MKERARQGALCVRNGMNGKDRKNNSSIICEKIKALDEFIKAKTIMLYYPTKSEVDIFALFKVCEETDKRICLPVVLEEKGQMEAAIYDKDTKLLPDRYGILYPHNSEKVLKSNIDLVIVPMVAFDEELNRIGYGSGYYDRFLNGMNAYKVGVAFSCQQVFDITKDINDIKMDKIITEKTSFVKGE